MFGTSFINAFDPARLSPMVDKFLAWKSPVFDMVNRVTPKLLFGMEGRRSPFIEMAESITRKPLFPLTYGPTNLRAVLPSISESLMQLSARPAIQVSINHLLDFPSYRLLPKDYSIPAFPTSIGGLDKTFADLSRKATLQATLANRFVPGPFVGRGLSRLAPGMAAFVEEYERTERGAQVLEDHGYGYANHIWTPRSLASFDGTDARVQAAIVTTRLLAFTRGADFEKMLHNYVKTSPLLRRRWEVIQAVLRAHARGEYVLSIPTALTQAEGIISDLLVLNGLAVQDKGKLYAKENGKLKSGRDRKPVELKGLATKVDHARWRNHEVLHGLSRLVENRLATERNLILHGSDTGYGKAKRSVQALLLLFVLCQEFHRLETSGRSSS